MSENVLNPHGVDVWLACEPADTARDHLLDGVAGALGLGASASLADVCEAVAGLAPTPVSLVLDDVHEVVDGSSGAAMLGELLDALPANGHVVAASRCSMPWPIERLVAQRRVIEITEDDLAFTEVELSTLSASHGVGPDELGSLAGWPALVSLALQARSPADFMLEEVLVELTEAQHRTMTALVAVGGASASFLRHLTGEDAATVLSDVPLVHHVDDRFVAHPLWSDHVEGAADEAELRTIRRMAIDWLSDAGEASEAVEMWLRFGDEQPPVAGPLRTIVIEPDTQPLSKLQQWATALPDAVLATGSGRLLQGLVERGVDPAASTCLQHFEAAAALFAEAEDGEAELVSIAMLAYYHYVHRDAAGLMGLFQRVHVLAERGIPGVADNVLIGQAAVATALGDPAEAIERLSEIDIESVPVALATIGDWLEANALNALGHDAVEAADRCLSRGLPIPGTVAAGTMARWRAGAIDELLDRGPVDLVAAGDRDVFVAACWDAIVCCGTGRVEAAEDHLALAGANAGSAEAWQVEAAIGIVKALIAYERFDDELAASVLGRLVADRPPGGAIDGYYAGAIGLFSTYLPEWNDHWAAREGGPFLHRDRAVVGALAAAKAGDFEPIADLNWPVSPGQLLPALSLRGTVELAVHAWDTANNQSRTVLEWLLDRAPTATSEHLASLATRCNDLEPTVLRVLASIPVRPVAVPQVCILGPPVLRLDDAVIEPDGWSRGQVRDLVGYMAMHRETSREQVMAALWPDVSLDMARRRLRSALNLAHQVLEPDRQAHGAPFFIRSEGDTLRMSRVLPVDVHRFEAVLDRAADLDAGGAPSAALELYVEATDLYRGHLLDDATVGEWVLPHRDRMQARFVAASVRAAELLAVTDGVPQAVAIASRALGVEPWSEPAHRAVITAHLNGGDTAAARRALIACQVALADVGGMAEERTLMIARHLEDGAV